MFDGKRPVDVKRRAKYGIGDTLAMRPDATMEGIDPPLPNIDDDTGEQIWYTVWAIGPGSVGVRGGYTDAPLRVLNTRYLSRTLRVIMGGGIDSWGGRVPGIAEEVARFLFRSKLNAPGLMSIALCRNFAITRKEGA